MATDKPRSIVTYVHRPMRPTIITVVAMLPNALQRAFRSWDVLHPIPVPCFRAVREGEGSEPMRPTIITVVAALTIAMVTDAWCQEPLNRSADWFLANPDAIPDAREWCHDHPTEVDAALKRGDQSCVNVEQAYTLMRERQTPK
jgi:hypothetical protein